MRNLVSSLFILLFVFVAVGQESNYKRSTNNVYGFQVEDGSCGTISTPFLEKNSGIWYKSNSGNDGNPFLTISKFVNGYWEELPGKIYGVQGYNSFTNTGVLSSEATIEIKDVFTQFDFDHNMTKTNTSVIQSMNGITATITNAESSAINFSEITGKGEGRVVSSNSATSKLTIMFSDSLAVYSLNVFAATMTGNTDVTLTPIVRTGSTLHLSDAITETVDLSTGKTFEVHFADIVGLEITAATAIDFGVDNIEFSRIEIGDILLTTPTPGLSVSPYVTSVLGERSYLIDKASCRFPQLDESPYLQIASKLSPSTTYTLSNIQQCVPDPPGTVATTDLITTLNSYPKVKNINI